MFRITSTMCWYVLVYYCCYSFLLLLLVLLLLQLVGFPFCPVLSIRGYTLVVFFNFFLFLALLLRDRHQLVKCNAMGKDYLFHEHDGT